MEGESASAASSPVAAAKARSPPISANRSPRTRHKRKGTPSSLSVDHHERQHHADTIRRRSKNSPRKSRLRLFTPHRGPNDDVPSDDPPNDDVPNFAVPNDGVPNDDPGGMWTRRRILEWDDVVEQSQCWST